MAADRLLDLLLKQCFRINTFGQVSWNWREDTTIGDIDPELECWLKLRILSNKPIHKGNK
jgi:hypothetical protein